MKKNIIIILFVLLAVIIIVCTLVVLDSKFNMRHYFDNWNNETNDNIISISYSSVYNNNGELLFEIDDDLHSLNIEIVYCVKGERIYFSYATMDPETDLRNIWHIASVSVSGKDFKEHYSGILFDDTIKYPTLKDLSCNTDCAEEYGGLYYDNVIYLHGNARTVAFDLETEITKEIDSLPVSRYMGKIENKQTLTVIDTENGATHTVTLESMANSNVYAKNLLELSTRKIWSGESPTFNLFDRMKTVDEQMYITCVIYNWNGDSFAVVFKYDFASDKVYYVSSNKVGGNVSSRYKIAPFY